MSCERLRRRAGSELARSLSSPAQLSGWWHRVGTVLEVLWPEKKPAPIWEQHGFVDFKSSKRTVLETLRQPLTTPNSQSNDLEVVGFHLSRWGDNYMGCLHFECKTVASTCFGLIRAQIWRAPFTLTPFRFPRDALPPSAREALLRHLPEAP